MEPPEIERLDERTIQRIAAGEVVERPASVVKELVENSLDAGATRVAVAVESGGTEGIRVRDDGVGIPSDQLEAAVAEHATSKISDIADLDRGVGTLGFRGEALYTIGAVSRLTVRSRPPDAEAGAEITVAGGDVGAVSPAGCPQGTTVEVDDLFFNTPARKKFLKRTATEFDHVNTVVTSYALANPDVAVSLEHDGRETFATEGNGDLRSAVLAVYGRNVAESMIDVEWMPDDTDDRAAADDSGSGEQPVNRVTGLVSHPETTRASRDYLATYVNERYVTAGTLREAVVDAYGGQLASDRYPFAVLFVDVPAGDVDVNVHPRKLEVRFDEERAVRDAVESAVTDALLDAGLIRSTAPRGRSAPDETPVAPERPGDDVVGGAGTVHERRGGDGTDESGDGPVDEKNASGSADGVEAGVADGVETEAVGGAEADAADHGGTGATDGNAIELDPDDEDAWAVDDLGSDGAAADAAGGDSDAVEGDSDAAGMDADAAEADSSAAEAGSDVSGTKPNRNRSNRSESRRLRGEADATNSGTAASDRETFETSDTTPVESGDSTDVASEDDRPVDLGEVAPSDPGSGAAGPSDPSSGVAGPSDPDSGAVTRPGVQHTLAGGTTSDERSFDSLPPLRVLGQLHDTYVVASAPDGLLLIDQHAADERVHYERLRETFSDGVAGQSLAAPVTVELTAREATLFAELDDELETIGFRAERAGDREVVVKAVPAVFDAALDPELLRDVLSALVSDAGQGNDPVDDAVDELLADLACYPSVTGNTSLTDGSVTDLLDRLDDCENPYACPHGRPVVTRFERAEIEERFERDYPGHGGRRSE